MSDAEKLSYYAKRFTNRIAALKAGKSGFKEKASAIAAEMLQGLARSRYTMELELSGALGLATRRIYETSPRVDGSTPGSKRAQVAKSAITEIFIAACLGAHYDYEIFTARCTDAKRAFGEDVRIIFQVGVDALDETMRKNRDTAERGRS